MPLPVFHCEYCGAAVEVRASVDIANGVSIRGRLTRFEQRCAAQCEHGREWNTTAPSAMRGDINALG